MENVFLKVWYGKIKPCWTQFFVLKWAAVIYDKFLVNSYDERIYAESNHSIIFSIIEWNNFMSIISVI